jgi:cardiolipin synthase A/B
VTTAAERLVIAPAARRRTVLQLIRAAERRLVLSIFRCDDRHVLRALADAAARGVHVRAIVTARAKATTRDLEHVCAWLTLHGVEVRRDRSRPKYHAKYLLADDAVALVTSLNFTAKCFARTCDFTLVTGDPDVASGVRALFDADWDGRPLELTPSQRARLIVAPDGGPRDRVATLLRGAHRSIRVLDAKLRDRTLRRVLDERRHDGIDVDVARRRAMRSLRAHGRLLILDGHTAVIGSLALSRRSLDQRRELAVIVRDPRLVAELEAFWQSQVRPMLPSATGAASVPLAEPAR